MATLERALCGQSPLLALILDTLPLGVGIYDHHGHLVHSNALIHPYVGLIGQASRDPTQMDRWRGYDGDDKPITLDRYPGNRALRVETVLPGIDFLHRAQDGSERWIRVGAAPVRGEAIVVLVVQDIDDLKRATQRVDAASAELACRWVPNHDPSRMLLNNLQYKEISIPNGVTIGADRDPSSPIY